MLPPAAQLRAGAIGAKKGRRPIAADHPASKFSPWPDHFTVGSNRHSGLRDCQITSD
jgi:hypothetical protein